MTSSTKTQPFSKLGSYEVLTLSVGISKLGNQFYYLVVPLYLLDQTHSPLLTAFFFALQYIPYFASSVLGIAVDRYDKRRLFVASEGTQLLLMLCFAFLLKLGGIESHLLIFGVLVFVLQICGITSALIIEYAMLPTVARSDDLTGWNAVYMTIINVCRLTGPVLGGAFMLYSAEYVMLLLNALTFLCTVVMGLLLPEFRNTRQEAAKEKQKRGSLHSFFKIPDLPKLIVGLSLYNLGLGGITLVVMTLLKSHYNAGAFQIGIALTISGIGTVLGSMLGKRIKSSIKNILANIRKWLFLCLIVSFLMLCPHMVFIYAGSLLISFCDGLIGVMSMTYRQQIIPKNMAGRMNGLIRTMLTSPVPVSFLIFGWVLNRFEQVWLSPLLITFFIFLAFIILQVGFEKKLPATTEMEGGTHEHTHSQ